MASLPHLLKTRADTTHKFSFTTTPSPISFTHFEKAKPPVSLHSFIRSAGDTDIERITDKTDDIGDDILSLSGYGSENDDSFLSYSTGLPALLAVRHCKERCGDRPHHLATLSLVSQS